MEDEPDDPIPPARGVLEGNRRSQADAAHIVVAKAQTIGEGAHELRVFRDSERWLASRRLAAPGQVWNNDPPVTGEGRSPRVEVLE